VKILVINAGSSSLKYQFIDMETEAVLAKGNCERIGIDGGIITHTANGQTYSEKVDFPTHTEAFEALVRVMTTGDTKVIESMSEISAVGHRVVQGAEIFKESCLVDDTVLQQIEDLAALAPLHNKAHALAIRACQKVLDKSVPQVVVFDTSFHSTMPKEAFLFAVPYEYYTEHHIRRYGAHGTSHRYVSARCAELMGKDAKDLKIVTCHLGNGSSITAVDGGKSVDTSMGLTPLDGIMMGTRSGAIDASAVTKIAEIEGMTPEQTTQFLNKKCGFLGVSGFTSDCRDLTKAADEGHERAQLACDMFVYQLKKIIGSYVAAMNGIDALVFTGGIGENTIEFRQAAADGLSFFGIAVDPEANTKFNHNGGEITAPGARVRTFIIPTNEELTIARDTLALIQ